MAAKIFDIGDTALVTVTFKDAAGAVADPTTVQFIVLDPSDNEVAVTFPNAVIANPSAGVFEGQVAVDEEGEFVVRFNGLGIGAVTQAAFEDIFVGRSSRMTDPLPTP